ncbi:MAG: SRPBCC family protein [Actinomycetota bacterium]|nr:SRPBCC family protein [Actinomycetota bacterium]
MTEAVHDSVAVDAPADVVWDLISDITRMPEWSPELTRATWLKGARAPVVGAKFKGRNGNKGRTWSTICTVTAAETGRLFSYRVTSFGLPVADWIYEIRPHASGCALTESTIDRRGALVRTLGGPVTGVHDRASHNLDGIRKTLASIKAVAEGPGL